MRALDFLGDAPLTSAWEYAFSPAFTLPATWKCLLCNNCIRLSILLFIFATIRRVGRSSLGRGLLLCARDTG